MDATESKEKPSRAKVAIGDKFNLLTVKERIGAYVAPNGGKKALWLCECECGKFTEVTTQPLVYGLTKSCGCLRKKLKYDFTGMKQGSLTVKYRVEDRANSDGRATHWWYCECECGGNITLRSIAIKNGANSCGCQYNRKTHGHTVVEIHGHAKGGHSPTYTTWHSMMQRCLNENHHAYLLYGAVGITVCERWKTFANFLEDMGERPDGLTLNRINSASEYNKDNCEWATLSMQAYDQKKRVTNKSGKTGVAWDKRLSKWEAYISVDRKKISLGFSDDLGTAIQLRIDAELKYYGFTKE